MTNLVLAQSSFEQLDLAMRSSSMLSGSKLELKLKVTEEIVLTYNLITSLFSQGQDCFYQTTLDLS